MLGNPSLTVPDNVDKEFNYYQKNGGPFAGTAITNPSADYGNTDVSATAGMTHNTIVGDQKQTVVTEINSANHERSSSCE